MDHYQIFELIGEGSFGKVHRGMYKPTGEDVAVKMVSKATTTVKLSSLKQECEIQKNLKHPNIIQMLDSIETADHIILITELASGDIYNRLIKKGPSPQARVQFIAYNLVSALRYLHSRRILHRDLKPQNILIGKDNLPKLCDFGFARTIGIDTYMLTSVKGTPLYMAPELVQRRPYDHNADLWALGCILYELCTGQAPFPTTSIFQLARKIQFDQVYWPPSITGHCRTFIEGLLEKDPQKRLTWPELLDHPFIHNFMLDVKPEEKFSLTKALSPSQELEKEKQRQVLQKRIQKKMENYSRILVKTVKKFEEAHRELQRCSTESHEPIKPSLNRHPSPTAQSSDSDSSIESLTSSSSSLSRTSDERQTVIEEKHSPGSSKKPLEIQLENLRLQEECKPINSSSRFYDIIWTSEGLHILHSMDKPIESEEWIDFVGKTMREVEDNPGSLCEKHFLSVLVAPLMNHLAEVGVVEKIATLLAMPFTLTTGNLELQQNLERIYYGAKVLPNLVYACKLMVRRRLLQRISMNFKSGDLVEDLMGIVEDEDLVGMDKCMRLITFLVHLQSKFAEQFCECVCGFKFFPILHLCLKSYERRVRLTVDTLAALCQILRTAKDNATAFETFLIEYENFEEIDLEIFNLLSHSDPNVQSKSFRLLGYLMTHSENVRERLVRPRSAGLWNILTQASNHPDTSISAAAEFTSGQLQQFIPCNKSEGSEHFTVSQ